MANIRIWREKFAITAITAIIELKNKNVRMHENKFVNSR